MPLTQEDTCSSFLKLDGWGVGVRFWSVQVGNLSSVVHPHSEPGPLSQCVGLCVEGHCEGPGLATVVSGASLLRQRARLQASTLPKQQTDWLTDCVSDWVTDWVSDWLLVEVARWLTNWLNGWLAVCLLDWLIRPRQKRRKCVFQPACNTQCTTLLSTLNKRLSVLYVNYFFITIKNLLVTSLLNVIFFPCNYDNYTGRFYN